MEFENSGIWYDLRNIYLIPMISVVIGCWQLFYFGYPYGHDWIFELVRVAEYADSLSNTGWLPYWAGNLYHGYGSPIFIYYAPLYIGIASLGVVSGLSVTSSAIVTYFAFQLIAMIGVTGMMIELVGRENKKDLSAARIAAFFYLLSPYFLSDMLLRNASAEFVALCIAPYPLWGLIRMYRGRKWGAQIVTIGIALSIVAHNLTALVVVSISILLSFILFFTREKYTKLFKSNFAIMLGIGISTWFWLPAIGMKDLVRIDGMTQGKFDFRNNFINLSEIFDYGSFFSIGWVPVVILIIGCYALFKTRDKVIMLLAVIAILFLYLQTSASKVVWEVVPFMPLFQFPWRMMGPFSLVVAVMAGLVFKMYFARIRNAELIFLIFIAANAIPLLHQYQPLPENVGEAVNHALTAQQILQRGLPATVLDEYLPRPAEKALSERMPRNREGIKVGNQFEKVGIRRSDSMTFSLEYKSNEETELSLAHWYFPGWIAYLDGETHEVYPGQEGELRVKLPAGEHVLNVSMIQPPMRRIGLIFSLAAVILFALMLRKEAVKFSANGKQYFG